MCHWFRLIYDVLANFEQVIVLGFFVSGIVSGIC